MNGAVHEQIFNSPPPRKSLATPLYGLMPNFYCSTMCIALSNFIEVLSDQGKYALGNLIYFILKRKKEKKNSLNKQSAPLAEFCLYKSKTEVHFL